MKKICVLSLLLICISSFAFAGTVNLPRTGQTKCYDTIGTEIPCAGTGQDGDIQAGVAWPEPRFTVNADTAIKDNLTGIVWAPDGNIMPTRDSGWDMDNWVNDGNVTWQHALDYVAKLNNENYLGHSDWRLPNVNELEALINANEFNSSWLNTQGFTNVQADGYWSSTSSASYPDDAWFVDMRDGYVGSGSGPDGGWFVWPVRGGQCGTSFDSVICLPKTGQTVSYYTGDDGDLEKGVLWPVPRFEDYGNGTVMDNLTGLMWLKDANLPGGTRSWQQALDYVASLNASHYLGYTDWRLPNRRELFSLIDHSQFYPALPAGHPFTNVMPDVYWSSTSDARTLAVNGSSIC